MRHHAVLLKPLPPGKMDLDLDFQVFRNKSSITTKKYLTCSFAHRVVPTLLALKPWRVSLIVLTFSSFPNGRRPRRGCDRGRANAKRVKECRCCSKRGTLGVLCEWETSFGVRAYFTLELWPWLSDSLNKGIPQSAKPRDYSDI
jgi:hypothetical protein